MWLLFTSVGNHYAMGTLYIICKPFECTKDLIIQVCPDVRGLGLTLLFLLLIMFIINFFPKIIVIQRKVDIRLPLMNNHPYITSYLMS